jgi:hypothetical protein
MAYRAVQLLDLPDEMLLMILKKLPCVHRLYSLEGINKRLDAMVVSKRNTNFINLGTINSGDDDICLNFDTILTRFCSHTLLRISHNVESFILEGAHVERVLLACDYPNLHNFNIVNFDADLAHCYLTGMNINYRQVMLQYVLLTLILF